MRRDPSTDRESPSSLRKAAGAPVGIVLAGGSSHRLGRDKTTLRVAGHTLTERAAGLLDGICTEVAVADGGRGLLPDRMSLSDSRARGPAGGILGAADRFPDRALLVLACDLPNITRELLAELARQRTADWVVPRWRRGIEPLCALYRPSAIARLRHLALDGKPAPHRLVGIVGLEIHWLEGEELERYGPPKELFHNLNRPADIAALGARIE